MPAPQDDVARLCAERLAPQLSLVRHRQPDERDVACPGGYIEAFLEATQRADWDDVDAARANVIAAMTSYLPSDRLQFLMELSIDPVADKLGLVPRPVPSSS